METCWNNIKLDWETLLEMLPTMLDKNGKYVYFGCEPDCTPYTIARARIASRAPKIDELKYFFVPLL